MANHLQPGSAGPVGLTFGAPPGDTDADPHRRPGPRWSLTAAGLAVIGAAFALIAGCWLMYAPFVLGYQNDFGTWNDATKTDFWDGFGLAVIGLLALVLTGLGFLGVLREAGVIQGRRAAVPEPAAPGAAPAYGTTSVGTGGPAPADELSGLLRPLIEALNRDNAEAAAGVVTPDRASSPYAAKER